MCDFLSYIGESLRDLLTGFWETKTWLQIEIHKDTNNNKNELAWMV